MSTLRVSLFLVVGLAHILPLRARAQAACSVPSWPPDAPTRSQSDSVLQMWNEVEASLWNWLRQWFVDHERSTLDFGGYADVRPTHIPNLAVDIRNRLTREPSLKPIAAQALAQIIRHNGQALLGEDVLAAGLYRDWGLAPDAALSVLRDPQATFRSRQLAVAALEGHWRETSFHDAAMDALCILSAQVAGVERIMSSSTIERVADHDQMDFLSTLASAFVDAYDRTGTRPLLDGRLPQENPVTRYLHTRLCAALGCNADK